MDLLDRSSRTRRLGVSVLWAARWAASRDLERNVVTSGVARSLVAVRAEIRVPSARWLPASPATAGGSLALAAARCGHASRSAGQPSGFRIEVETTV